MAPVSVAAKRTAVTNLYTQQKSVKVDYDASQAQLKKAEAKVAAIMQGVANGTPLDPKALLAANTELTAARKTSEAATQRYGQAVLVTHNAQEEVLKLHTTGKSGIQLDSVQDAASLTVAEQTKLLGAPVAFDMGAAVEGDGKRVSVAIKTETKKGAQMLGFQLDGAEPDFQSKLIKRAEKNIKTMVRAANQDPATAAALMDTISKTKGPAREQLLAIVAKELPSTEMMNQKWLETTQKGMLIGQLRADVKQGNNLDVAADLITALKKAGRPNEAGDVVSITADGLNALRGEYEKRQAKVDDLDAHLGRLAGGFGTALGETKSQKAMEAFRAKHTADYAKLNESAEKYLKATDVISKLPRIPQKEREAIAAAGKMNISLDLNREQRLDREITQFTGKNFDRLFDTEPGRRQLEAGLKDQLAGRKSWVTDLVESSKANKDLKEFVAEKVPNLIARGIGHMALANNSENLKQLLKSNASILGLSNVDEFMKHANQLSKTGRTAEEVNTALKNLDSDNYHPALKKLGGLLALPGAIEALGKSDASTPDKVKALIDGVTVLSALKDSKVLEGVAKKLGPIANGIEMGLGIEKLISGNKLEGVSQTMSGLGGFMMTAGMITSRIPGAQLIGAALVVGSVIVGKFVETDSEKAEKAAQKDAKAYLEAGGLKPAAATALGNLNESDHRDIGGFINQIAPRFGMDGARLLEHLAELSPGKLRELTEMVFKMKVDPKGAYTEKKKLGPFGADSEKIFNLGPHGTISPQSMDTAEAWMRSNGLDLKDEKPD